MEPWKCYKCNHLLPPALTYSGKHVKASCMNCGCYIKFVPQTTIPSYVESKQKIWVITQDKELIEDIKSKMGVFHNELKGLYANVAYHNLYSQIIKHFS